MAQKPDPFDIEALERSLNAAASGGSGITFAIVQPTLTANCMIRVLAKFEGAPHDKMVANDNSDLVAIVYRRSFVAA
jgi:hypothetical protein